MSFATRCTACGTIFRVVQDQLRVSDGWVRCGRCDAVFDAAGGLFDLEQEVPPDWQPPALPAADSAPVEAPTGRAAESEDERRWAASMATQRSQAEGAQAEGATASTGHAANPMPPPAVKGAMVSATFEPPPGLLVRDTETAGSSDRINAAEEDDVIVITDHPTSERRADEPWATGPDGVGDGAGSPGSGDPGFATAALAPTPDFLRAGRRRASLQGVRARALLWTLALLLLVALVLQSAQHFSELAAARWPAARSVLGAWCAVSGCSVGPPHRIDDIVVESTALSPGPAASGLRLAVTLRNRAAYPVALPSIDLSLTDTSGKLIARRVLSPVDFIAPAPAVASLAAGADLPLQTVLTAGGVTARVAGYTVEIFYP